MIGRRRRSKKTLEQQKEIVSKVRQNESQAEEHLAFHFTKMRVRASDANTISVCVSFCMKLILYFLYSLTQRSQLVTLLNTTTQSQHIYNNVSLTPYHNCCHYTRSCVCVCVCLSFFTAKASVAFLISIFVVALKKRKLLPSK